MKCVAILSGLCNHQFTTPLEFGPETVLEDLEEWDSLAAISYVVMMDEEFNKIANPSDIQRFKTVNDILNSME